MGNRRLSFLFLCIVGVMVILSVAGCDYGKIMNDKVKCTITAGDVITIYYKEKEYVVLDEEINANDLGHWIGYIYQNISGVMFATVYQYKEDDSFIAVAADNLFYRAIEKDKLTDDRMVLVLEESEELSETKGQQEISVNATNVTEITYGDKIYQVTEEKLDRKQLGNFIASIAKYMVYDIESLTEVDKKEYTKIDWDGGDNDRYAVRVYGNVYHIKDTEDKLGVEVNGVYYIAIEEKE